MAASNKLMPTDIFVRQKTQYDTLDFGDYAFAEFPMAVPVIGDEIQPTPYDGRGKLHEVVIVNSQAELDALKGPGVALVEVDPTIPNSPKRVATDEDLREALFTQAEQSGAQIDKSWPTGRIEKAIQDHEASKAKPKAAAKPGADVI